MKRLLHSVLNNWFPLGLLALGLAAIPGVILVVLALIEADGPINAWLLEEWQITYQLALSPWVALVLLLMPIVLIVLYFLKLKRKPIQVPSTFLWKKSIEDLHVNSLFQWLRNNVLLLLQLLVLLFLIYSVLGLRYHGSTGTSRHYILMIDNSASMSAQDVSPSRLEWAKQEALKEIDAAAEHDNGMVIVFNSKATTMQTYTSDRARLRDAVRSIQPTQRPTRIEEALALAESLANPVRSTDDAAMQPDDVREEQRRTMVPTRGVAATIVHFYSDGRFAKLSEATLANLNSQLAGISSSLGNLNLHYHMAGKIDNPGNTNNLALVGFNVLRQPVGSKKKPGQQFLAFVRVANYRSSKAVVKLNLDVYVDGILTHPLQEIVTIAERKYVAAVGDGPETDEPGEADKKFTLPPIEARRNIFLHAYLDKPNDAFPLDDQAWLVVGTTRRAKVLIVGRVNPILNAFFDQEETKKLARTERLVPEDLNTETYRKKARSGEFDLVIFDRCAPGEEADMPTANTFFIDRPPPPWQRGTTRLKNPQLMPSKQDHPLMRHLTTLWKARTHEAFAFDVQKNLDPKTAKTLNLPEGDPNRRSLPSITRLLETSNRMPLLFTLPRGPHTDLVMTFPLMNDEGELVTDWPLQTSLPLFFLNVLHILGNVDESVRAVSAQPGEPVVLRPEAGVTELEITTPARQVFRLPRGPRTDFPFTETEQVGVYRVHAVPGEQLTRSFTVNLLDANESNIEPRSSIRIGNQQIAAGEEKTQPREIWKWILLLAVVLLSVEWYIYHRRIAV